MSIRWLKKMALLLTFWVALHGRCLKAQTITGDTVTNNLTVTGSNVLMGTQTGTNNPGWGTIYMDGTNSTVEIEATRNGNTWAWEEHNGTIMQMMLDDTNTMTLYNSSGTNEITLNPTGTSSFASSVTLNGTNNTMPHQLLTGTNSVLTKGLADSLYISSFSSAISIGSGPTISLNGGSASGVYSFAEGSGSSASNIYSVAMGDGASASGKYSVAMGQGVTAQGNYSTALGQNSWAEGTNSTASGYQTTASGNFSMAMGYWTTASGNFSVAMGAYTHANGTNSVAMGCDTTATNTYSTAMGYITTANGLASTAMGYITTANGLASTAMGNHSTANGTNSTASGPYTTAMALDSFVMGTYNVGLNVSGTNSSTNTWVAGDPLFEIGNGQPGYTSSSGYYTWVIPPGCTVSGYNSTSGYYVYPYIPPAPADAFVVYKNGNAALQGSLRSASLCTSSNITAHAYITTTQTGDIPMYLGN